STVLFELAQTGGISSCDEQLGSNNRVESWFVRPPSCLGVIPEFVVPLLPCSWPGRRIGLLLRSNPSAVPGANTEWGGTMPPSSIRDWHQSAKSFHAAARARHSAYVNRLLSICQMIVASLRITATRAIVEPRLRLIRLNHSRNRASLRRTLCTNCASSQRAIALRALVMLPIR